MTAVPPLELTDARPPEFSDEALALRFTARHGAKARYVALWGKWLLWDGSRWEFDDTMRVFDLSRSICRAASSEAQSGNAKIATAIASARTVAAVINLARADRRHAATTEQWDLDPWLLNTPGGVIDLQTGKTLPHKPTYHMTKITAVSPQGNCPRWHKFLAEITDGNAEFVAFLKRMTGYQLTGITRDHALFFAYGTGGNGKGSFINTLTAILGDYSAVAPMDTFTVTRHERHPTDLAGLRGARLVASQETDEGRRWDEAKIKALTGGDPITARFMRQDFFTFQPQFKLLIAGNHKPTLRSVDDAIRRRFHLIPFTVKITEPDKGLPERLQGEWPGILQWAIEGCLEWREIGLNPPPVVRHATDGYLANEDVTAQWIDERCSIEPGDCDRAVELFNNWKSWAEAAGEFVGSQKRFAQILEDRGFVRFRDSRTRQAKFRGIAITAHGN